MAEYIERDAAIAYIREQSEECQKAFEELGGESGIYADAYNDLAEDFYSIPAADVAPVVRCMNCRSYNKPKTGWCEVHLDREHPDDFCGYGKQKDGGDNNG